MNPWNNEPTLELAWERLRTLTESHEELRQELHERYLDKYELQAEYISRLENERHVAASMAAAASRWNRWAVVGGTAVALTSFASLVIQLAGVLAGG